MAKVSGIGDAGTGYRTEAPDQSARDGSTDAARNSAQQADEVDQPPALDEPRASPTSTLDALQPSTSNASANANDDKIFPDATREELEDDLNWYDHDDASARRDQVNAFKATSLGDVATRGYPEYDCAFEQGMPSLAASVGALPECERGQFTGEVICWPRLTAIRPTRKTARSSIINSARSAMQPTPSTRA